MSSNDAIRKYRPVPIRADSGCTFVLFWVRWFRSMNPFKSYGLKNLANSPSFSSLGPTRTSSPIFFQQQKFRWKRLHRHWGKWCISTLDWNRGEGQRTKQPFVCWCTSTNHTFFWITRSTMKFLDLEGIIWGGWLKGYDFATLSCKWFVSLTFSWLTGGNPMVTLSWWAWWFKTNMNWIIHKTDKWRCW